LLITSVLIAHAIAVAASHHVDRPVFDVAPAVRRRWEWLAVALILWPLASYLSFRGVARDRDVEDPAVISSIFAFAMATHGCGSVWLAVRYGLGRRAWGWRWWRKPPE
jgi:hypothetical protein